MKCLITGGAGFIGSHLVEHLMTSTDWDICVVDSLTYAAGRGERLAKFRNNPRFTFQRQDIRHLTYDFCNPDYIVHLAAETHVERSIIDPAPFIQTNIVGTYRMLSYGLQQKNLKKFLYFSTDEVFGASYGEVSDEDAPYNSGNPYAASKAAAEELALAWSNTFKFPLVISHCSNVFGPGQHEEKFIPKLVDKISRGEKVLIHADEDGQVGSRMYVHVSDVARAIVLLLERGQQRTKYNIPGILINNLQMAEIVADALGRTLVYEKMRPDNTRPGWDFSYRISGKKLLSLGWKRYPDCYKQLCETVESYACKVKSEK